MVGGTLIWVLCTSHQGEDPVVLSKHFELRVGYSLRGVYVFAGRGDGLR